jgi:hypothetical protein
MPKPLVVVACTSALCACATLAPKTQEELIDGQGISSPILVVDAVAVRFVNRDLAQPHQIHSDDCPELSSLILYPGDAHTAQVGRVPRLCHFVDLLAPAGAAYVGTLEVRRPETAD